MHIHLQARPSPWARSRGGRALPAIFAAAAMVAVSAAAEPQITTLDQYLDDQTPQSSAEPVSGDACQPAIAAAASSHTIPTDLLLAIGMVESGLTPWVLNAAGTPRFFDDMASAAAELDALRTAGTESIDVGCMQVNLRWHPDAFTDSLEALTPASNADYAAKFLLSLYAMTGSWTDAVAYYHSSAQRYQRPYVCAVAARLEEIGSAIELDCQPDDMLDLPVIADSTPSIITGPAVPAPIAGQRMVRVAPSAGSGPAVVRGQPQAQVGPDYPDAPSAIAAGAPPRILRVR